MMKYDSEVPKPKGVSLWSAAAALLSVLSIGLFCLIFSDLVTRTLIFLWASVSAVAIVLPPFAKYFRLREEKRGRGLEITAIVLAGFSFCEVIFILTRWPAWIGYTGWVLCGIVYHYVSRTQKAAANIPHTHSGIPSKKEPADCTPRESGEDEAGREILKLMLQQMGAAEAISVENKGMHLENLEDPELGLTDEKPIYTKGIFEQENYLKSLCLMDGTPIQWNRRGSVAPRGIQGMVDIFDIADIRGKPCGTIYINMYGSGTTPKAPTGFRFSDGPRE